jgi:hypothetical protein
MGWNRLIFQQVRLAPAWLRSQYLFVSGIVSLEDPGGGTLADRNSIPVVRNPFWCKPPPNLIPCFLSEIKTHLSSSMDDPSRYWGLPVLDIWSCVITSSTISPTTKAVSSKEAASTIDVGHVKEGSKPLDGDTIELSHPASPPLFSAGVQEYWSHNDCVHRVVVQTQGTVHTCTNLWVIQVNTQRGGLDRLY